MGELRVPMIGSEAIEIQRRVPAKGSFSATFKAGAAFSRVEESAPVWKGVRETLSKSLPGLAEAAGCPAGTPLLLEQPGWEELRAQLPASRPAPESNGLPDTALDFP